MRSSEPSNTAPPPRHRAAKSCQATTSSTPLEPTNLVQARLAAWLNVFSEPSSQLTARAQAYPHHATIGLLSQNVRGFTSQGDTQDQWLTGWKRLLDGRRVLCIALQETHVTSSADAIRLEQKWSRQ